MEISCFLVELSCGYARPHFFEWAIPQGKPPNAGESRIYLCISTEDYSAALA
jgi:hypothetical protein